MEYEIREEKGFKYRVVGEQKNGEVSYFEPIENLRKRCRGGIDPLSKKENEPCFYHRKGKCGEYPTTSRPCQLTGEVEDPDKIARGSLIRLGPWTTMKR